MIRVYRQAIKALVLFLSPAVYGGEDPANLTYSGIYDNPVTLANGLYEGEPFVEGGAARRRVWLAPAPRVVDDLDGDGHPDTAVLLFESSGGSGENAYLAVLSPGDGGLRQRGIRLIGDRVKIRSLVGAGGALTLDYVTTGPEEPACCPTLKVRGTYRLEGEELAETAREEQGAQSLTDLEGVTWRLVRLGRSTPVPDGVEANVRFEGGHLTGTGGCNRYFAEVRAEGADGLQVGPVGATRRLCPDPEMAVEDRFFAALSGVTRFGFVLGELVLEFRSGDGVDGLYFVAEPAASP